MANVTQGSGLSLPKYTSGSHLVGDLKATSSTIEGNAQRAKHLKAKAKAKAQASLDAKAAARAAAAPGMFKRAGAAIARNKKTAIGVGVGLAAVGGVGGYYAMRKRRRNAEG